MSEETLLSVEEISKHNNPDDCWIVVDGKVWDMTEFAPEHPGGSNGKDIRSLPPFHIDNTLRRATREQSSGNMPVVMRRHLTLPFMPRLS